MGWGGTTGQLVIALVAYAAYDINAGQFLLKLRAARLDRRAASPAALGAAR
jgi:3-vinyl bacteriochlorophyllide hydratase